MASFVGTYYENHFGEDPRLASVKTVVANDTAPGRGDGDQLDAVSQNALAEDAIDISSYLRGFQWQDNVAAPVVTTPAFIREGSGVTFTASGSGNAAGVIISAGAGAGPAFVSAVASPGPAFSFTNTNPYTTGVQSLWVNGSDEIMAIRMYTDGGVIWPNLELTDDGGDVFLVLGRGTDTGAVGTPGLTTPDETTPRSLLVQPGAQTIGSTAADATIQGGESGTGANDGGDVYVIGGPNKAGSGGNTGRVFIQTPDQVASSGNTSGGIFVSTGAGEGAGGSGVWSVTTGLPGATGDSGSMSWTTADAAGGASGGMTWTTGSALDASGGIALITGPTTVVAAGDIFLIGGNSSAAGGGTITIAPGDSGGAFVGAQFITGTGDGGATGNGGASAHTTGAGGSASGNSGAYTITTGSVTTPGTDLRGAFSVDAGLISLTAAAADGAFVFNIGPASVDGDVLFALNENVVSSSTPRLLVEDVGGVSTTATIVGTNGILLFQKEDRSKDYGFVRATSAAFQFKTDKAGSNIAVDAGNGTGAIEGGDITFTAGDGGPTDAAGGVITATSGAGKGTANSGNITLESPAAAGSGTRGDIQINGLKIGLFGTTPATQPADIGALTLTTGTPDNTLTDVSGSGDDTTINENFADLGDQMNDMRTAIRSVGLMA